MYYNAGDLVLSEYGKPGLGDIKHEHLKNAANM